MMTTATSPALTITRLRFTYPAHRRQPALRALTGIDLGVDAGQAVALLGPNGSGKSTLLKLISASLPPESGNVLLFGECTAPAHRWRLGVVFQRTGLDPHLTVLENLRFQAALYGLTGSAAQRRIQRELDRAGLQDRRDALVKTLSLGLARRVDLCRALLHDPDLLLLDEPTVGLDPSARPAFLDALFARRAETGLTILMSTHLTDEADRCDRVVLLNHGAIVGDGEPQTLRRTLGERMITVLGPDDPPPLIEELAWERHEVGWTAVCEDGPERIGSISAALIAADCSFRIAPPTLADVFRAVTGDSLAADDAPDGAEGDA